MPNMLGPVPIEAIKEVHTWRDKLTLLFSWVNVQQYTLNVPSYPTASAPTAVAGTMYFDITLGKFKACEVTGTWKTVTTS